MEQRKILFKAKRLDNAEWVEGSLLISEKGRTCIGAMLDPDEKKNNSPVCFSCREVDPSTVCQFTGLKDMKGREIWEHDYVTDFPTCGEVIFIDGGFGMHSDVGDLPLESFIDRLEDSPLKTFGLCLVTNQGSIFDRKEEK